MDNSDITTAVELKGIVHNSTKLGTLDGQCEDLINLRFKDNSWRATGDGRIVFTMGNIQEEGANRIPDIEYKQLFVHTNVYRHLLGVRDNKLCWFANIETDGSTFTPLTKVHEITTFYGDDLYICQTGHLLTIIDSKGSFEYALFNNKTDSYKVINVDENGAQNARGLYPYGAVHFNLDSRITEEHRFATEFTDFTLKIDDYNDFNQQGSTGCWRPHANKGNSVDGRENFHAEMIKCYGAATEKNRFTRPFMAMIAVKLYDGTYSFASAPVLLFPRQSEYQNSTGEITNCAWAHSGGQKPYTDKDNDSQKIPDFKVKGDSDYKIDNFSFPVYSSFIAATYFNQKVTPTDWSHFGRNTNMYSRVIGSDLLLSIEDVSMIMENSDLFKGIGVFVTPQIDLCYMGVDDWTKGSLYDSWIKTIHDKYKEEWNFIITYKPKYKTYNDIKKSLDDSPFFLLRDYSIDELAALKENPYVNLQDNKYTGLLNNIANGDVRFSSNFIGRTSYLPKVAYSYNQRLHIANYESSIFHGFPIELFMHNNRACYVNKGSNDLGLRNIKLFDGDKPYNSKKFIPVDCVPTQYRFDTNTGYRIPSTLLTSTNAFFAAVKVWINNSDGTTSVVCRYLNIPGKNGKGFYDEYSIEALQPYFFYPDSRATKAEIYILTTKSENGGVYAKLGKKEIRLIPHPTLNMAYACLNNNLLPTPLVFTDYRISDADGLQKLMNELGNIGITEEQCATETNANCLKVSSINNPFIFPAENTYQVGSSEIMALCSNSVSVGTGQTGASPLYVFCKDGLYALMVDSSGEMVYTNSRIIARDVINQYNRATPIDDGVVFTTDRGLMLVSGSEVEELGQPLEGDFEDFGDDTGRDYNKIAANAYTMAKIAALPSDSQTKVDFLEFLKGAMVNYNHNERELMVSNPAYEYTYILDRNANWSRRDYGAEQYVNNYPTSYRLKGNRLYQVDKDSDAKNGIFVMSKVLKFDSIAFKQLHRVIARGFFELDSKPQWENVYHKQEEISDGKVYSTECAISDVELNEQSSDKYYLVSKRAILDTTDYGADSVQRILHINFPQTNETISNFAFTILSEFEEKYAIDKDRKDENYITFTYRVKDDTTGLVVYEVVIFSSVAQSGQESGCNISEYSIDVCKVDLDEENDTTLIINDKILTLDAYHKYSDEIEVDVNVYLVAKDTKEYVIRTGTENHGDYGYSADDKIPYNYFENAIIPLDFYSDLSNNDSAFHEFIELKQNDSNSYVCLHIKNGAFARFTINPQENTFDSIKIMFSPLKYYELKGGDNDIFDDADNQIIECTYDRELSETDTVLYKILRFDTQEDAERLTNYSVVYECPFSVSVKSELSGEIQMSLDASKDDIFLPNIYNNKKDIYLGGGYYVEVFQINGKLKIIVHLTIKNRVTGEIVATQQTYYVSSFYGFEDRSIVGTIGGEFSDNENEIEIYFQNEPFEKSDITYIQSTDDYCLDGCNETIPITLIDNNPFYYNGREYKHVSYNGIAKLRLFNDSNYSKDDGCPIIISRDNDFVIPDGYACDIRIDFDDSDARIIFFSSILDSLNNGAILSSMSKLRNISFVLVDENKDVVYRVPSSTVSVRLADDGLSLAMSDYDMGEEGAVPLIINSIHAGKYSFGIQVEGADLYIQDKAAVHPFGFDGSAGITIQSYKVTEQEPEVINYVLQPADKSYSTQNTIDKIIPAYVTRELKESVQSCLGLYIFGSYDGRKWVCLGHREKWSKSFRDIGALVERTDCKFFRFVLAGQISKDSRFDYFEVSGKGSKLSTKIR